MELIQNFGFEPVYFGAQVINFLILAFVFKKFLYKPILKALRDREKKIAKGLEDAAASEAALASAEEKKDQIIKRATTAAQEIIEETKKNAESLRLEVLEKSRKDADKIIEEARIAAANELAQSRKDSESAALELSRKILRRILDELFTKDEREKILARDIKKLSDL